jgi:hypothetical protein
LTNNIFLPSNDESAIELGNQQPLPVQFSVYQQVEEIPNHETGHGLSTQIFFRLDPYLVPLHIMCCSISTIDAILASTLHFGITQKS